jgi:hypothetical protein
VDSARAGQGGGGSRVAYVDFALARRLAFASRGKWQISRLGYESLDGNDLVLRGQAQACNYAGRSHLMQGVV